MEPKTPLYLASGSGISLLLVRMDFSESSNVTGCFVIKNIDPVFILCLEAFLNPLTFLIGERRAIKVSFVMLME